ASATHELLRFAGLQNRPPREPRRRSLGCGDCVPVPRRRRRLLRVSIAWRSSELSRANSPRYDSAMARPRPMRVTRELPARTFEAGQVIFQQGDPMHGEAYMIHEGKVEVRRSAGGAERALRTLVKGDLLGEVAFFRNAPHSVTAVAVERVTLHVISAD